jgi:hypothetical protein
VNENGGRQKVGSFKDCVNGSVCMNKIEIYWLKKLPPFALRPHFCSCTSHTFSQTFYSQNSCA